MILTGPPLDHRTYGEKALGGGKNYYDRAKEDLPRHPRSLHYVEGAPRLRLMHRAASGHRWTEPSERGFVMAMTKKAGGMKGKKKTAKTKTMKKKTVRKMARAR